MCPACNTACRKAPCRLTRTPTPTPTPTPSLTLPLTLPLTLTRYIEHPLLVGGRKFDLRLYVLVTSYAPLTVYMYRSGFARFSLYRYKKDSGSLGDTFVHLTNAAAQKTAPGFDVGAGSKWPLHAFKLYLVAKFGSRATDACFAAVEQLVIHSLLSVQKIMIHDKHCFECYGYDIMIDSNLKPWLLEVRFRARVRARVKVGIRVRVNC